MYILYISYIYYIYIHIYQYMYTDSRYPFIGQVSERFSKVFQGLGFGHGPSTRAEESLLGRSSPQNDLDCCGI